MGRVTEAVRLHHHFAGYFCCLVPLCRQREAHHSVTRRGGTLQLLLTLLISPFKSLLGHAALHLVVVPLSIPSKLSRSPGTTPVHSNNCRACRWVHKSIATRRVRLMPCNFLRCRRYIFPGFTHTVGKKRTNRGSSIAPYLSVRSENMRQLPESEE